MHRLSVSISPTPPACLLSCAHTDLRQSKAFGASPATPNLRVVSLSCPSTQSSPLLFSLQLRTSGVQVRSFHFCSKSISCPFSIFSKLLPGSSPKGGILLRFSNSETFGISDPSPTTSIPLSFFLRALSSAPLTLLPFSSDLLVHRRRSFLFRPNSEIRTPAYSGAIRSCHFLIWTTSWLLFMSPGRAFRKPVGCFHF
jgi:hypothetical protein